MSLRSRLVRLEQRAPRPPVERPWLAAILDNGDILALINSEWVPWPPERPLPINCALIGFDPRNMGI